VGASDDNPFAAPPQDRPDQPWQPRHPSHAPGSHGDGGNGDGENGGEGRSDGPPVWGSKWSDRQPGRQSGGFGGRPGGPSGQGRGGPEDSPGGLRWDPTDPVQRRARYAVLGGMWAFFFALFDFPEIAMLLGALAVYWSISALRGGPRKLEESGTGTGTGAPGPGRAPAPTPSSTRPGAAAGAAQNSRRQQTTAAVSGLVTALLALAIVATGYTVQLVYRDYYTCVNDALTKSGALSCNGKLPDPLVPFFGVQK
jgi:Flp pilus assembly pilin Flp